MEFKSSNPMKVLLTFIFLLVSQVRCDPMDECQKRNMTYKIGDTKQCDMYHDCNKAGKLLEDRLCPDGLVFNLAISDCDYPYNVNCSARPLLQPSQSTDPNCPRSNGFYEFPSKESCQKFYHCLEDVAYEKECPAGVIWDPTRGVCVQPDLARRPGCAAKDVLNFECPNSLNKYIKLKFGDHDRFPHPSDCRMFIICLKDGRPRIAGCPITKVFNSKSGYCDSPKNVDKCKDYYGSKNLTQLALDNDFDKDFQFDNGESALLEHNKV